MNTNRKRAREANVMKSQSQVFSALLIPFLLSGCRGTGTGTQPTKQPSDSSQPDAGETETTSSTSARPSATRAVGAGAKLKRLTEKQMAAANDPKGDRKTRALAIFALFAQKVKTGMTSAQVHAALMSPTWLGDVNLYGVYALGGLVPVDIAAPESTVFCVHLFPNKKGWSPWVIYFRLNGKSGLTKKQGLAFLKGTLSDESIRLAEYALCFPGAKKILRFTPKGMHRWGTPRGKS